MGVRRIRHESEQGQWEMVRASPHPSLRAYVGEYVGWFEHFAVPICRREVPTEIVPLIINFGAPVRLFDVRDPSRWDDFGSFTTGAYDTYVLVGTNGPSGGLQVNLSILGARLFLGQPLKELRNRAIALDDLFGAGGSRLVSALYDAPTWDARFTILDRELTTRMQAARVTMRFHKQVTIDTRLVYMDRVLDRERWLFVRGVQNTNDANHTLVLFCEEVVP